MSYATENTGLLKTILDASFFKPWRNKEKYRNIIERRDLAIELYVTSACNQKCEYCYLVRHGEELYPKELRDHKTILKNLDLLINYLIENKYDFHRFDIFSGEILHTSFGTEILDHICEGKKRGLMVDEIHIPTNCSFILDDVAVKRLQESIDRLKDVGVVVMLSGSLDGLVIEEDSRPFVDGKKAGVRDQEFYDKAFEFVLKNNGGFHPMISAHSVERWKDNFRWWEQQCDKFNIDLPSSVMTLEVRNDEWSADKIKSYCDFLMFYGDWMFDTYCGGDAELFTQVLLGLECDKHIFGYLNLFLTTDTQILTCSVSHQLTIRLGDLAICPCHRTSYPDYLYGKFTVEGGKITGYEAVNPFIAAKVLMMNQRVCHHGCDTCWNKNYCIRQCLGAQLEAGQEIFMPAESVCKMLKEKTATLRKIYRKYGVYEEAKNLLYTPMPLSDADRNRVTSFLTLFESLEDHLAKYERLQDEACE